MANDVEDQVPLRAAACGDGAAFALFYRRHVATVLAYVMARVGSREIAADLAAETIAGAQRLISSSRTLTQPRPSGDSRLDRLGGGGRHPQPVLPAGRLARASQDAQLCRRTRLRRLARPSFSQRGSSEREVRATEQGLWSGRLGGALRKAIGMVVVGAVLSVGASTARAGDLLDRSSAAKFVGYATTFIRVAVTKEQAERRAMNKFVATIQRDCPGALPGSLLSGSASEQRTYTALAEEAALEFGLAADAPLRAAADRFTSELARLRWNDKRLARAIAISDNDVRALFSLKGPRLCADVAAAAATGFTHTPQDTIAFLNTANRRGDFGDQADPTFSAFLRSMKQYLRGDQPAMSRLRRLDHRFEPVFDNLASREAARLVNTLVSAVA